jgi:hypothetical protein
VLPPLIANLLAFIFAFYAANTIPLITAIAAKLVVADAVVDVREWYVGRIVTFVFTIEAGENSRMVE